jgi:hypothetical protein
VEKSLFNPLISPLPTSLIVWYLRKQTPKWYILVFVLKLYFIFKNIYKFYFYKKSIFKNTRFSLTSKISCGIATGAVFLEEPDNISL